MAIKEVFLDFSFNSTQSQETGLDLDVVIALAILLSYNESCYVSLSAHTRRLHGFLCPGDELADENDDEDDDIETIDNHNSSDDTNHGDECETVF